MATILGLDPGSHVAGFAIIKASNNQVRWVDSGSLVMPKTASHSRRLHVLYQQLDHIFTKHRPDFVAVEKAFFGKNADSAFKLGQTRGVCLLQAEKYGAELHEYAAKRIKKVITGSGAATKEHVQLVVGQLVGRQFCGPFDETDAIAIALCHLHEQLAKEKLGNSFEGSP